MLIKEAYVKYPIISYPMITIEETENEENVRFSTDLGEQISNLSYRFAIYGRQSATMDAVDMVRDIATKLDTLMKTDTYKCLKRVGRLNILPMVDDQNIIIGYLDYNGSLDINTNTIYRRY